MPTDENEVFEARKTWWDTRDAGKALDCLGSRPSLERHLLFGLKKCSENDLVNALSMVRLPSLRESTMHKLEITFQRMYSF